MRNSYITFLTNHQTKMKSKSVRIKEYLRERTNDNLDDFYYVDGLQDDFEPLQKSRELTLLRDFLNGDETVLRIRRDIQNCQTDSRDNRWVLRFFRSYFIDSIRITFIHPIFVLFIAVKSLVVYVQGSTFSSLSLSCISPLCPFHYLLRISLPNPDISIDAWLTLIQIYFTEFGIWRWPSRGIKIIKDQSTGPNHW